MGVWNGENFEALATQAGTLSGLTHQRKTRGPMVAYMAEDEVKGRKVAIQLSTLPGSSTWVGFDDIFLSSSAPVDPDDDGMPSDWESDRELNPEASDANADDDGDGIDNYLEFIADTDPRSKDSKQYFTIRRVEEARVSELRFPTSSNRRYLIEYSEDFARWFPLRTITGNDQEAVIHEPEGVGRRFYRLTIALP